MDLSIVIVNWNTKDFTRACLASLLPGDPGLSMEILVVDNASADGSQEMIRREFPGVTLIENQDNLGFAKANNIAVRGAKGKYIALINSDVTVPSGCLRKVYEYLEAHPAVGMLGPKMLTPEGVFGPSCMRRPTLSIWAVHAFGLSSVFKKSSLHMEAFDSTAIQEVDVLNGWFWVVRAAALEKVGLLDEQFFMYGEDIDWCHRFWKHGWKIMYYPEAEATHYGGGSSKRAPIRFYVEMQRANFQYWKRHHGWFSQAVYILLVGLHQSFRIAGYGLIYGLKPSSREETSFKISRSAACLRWLMGRWNPESKASS